MKPFTEFFNEARVSLYNFDYPSLQAAYKITHKEFLNQGFTAASTFAIWDYIYRLLPKKVKTANVQMAKKKHSGTKLRPFVVDLVNSSLTPQSAKALAKIMTNPENVKSYLQRSDYGNRRSGLLKKLSQDSGYEVKQNF